MEELNIEFGCGELPRQSTYKTCDIRNLPGIDYVCKAWEIDKLVAENSVDNIYSRHFFEHLTFAQGEIVLTVWYKILKPKGKILMLLPDLDFHVKQWLDGTDTEHACAGLFGWQRGELEDLWDVHKSGYSFETLKKAFEDAGFVNFSRHKASKEHLKISAFKPE
jgi:predicted SAM-dependent methyltransferase